jgi:DNA-binding CsgD family transcriptional regulator
VKAHDNKIFYELYNSLYSFCREAGEAGIALRYLDTATVYHNIIAKELDLSKKNKAEMALENERRVMSEKLLENEKENHRLVRNSLVGAVVCLLVISLLVFNRQRLKNRNREQQLLTEKQLAEQELASASLRLNDFAKRVREKNELIEEATRQIEQANAEINVLKNSSPAMAPATLNIPALQQLQDSILLTNDDWINFTELFEKVYPGFFNRLKHNLPGLSPAETRFMALCKLRYSNKEMAGMLGIGPDAVRQYRSRLRKKLNLPEHASFEEMADSI